MSFVTLSNMKLFKSNVGRQELAKNSYTSTSKENGILEKKCRKNFKLVGKKSNQIKINMDVDKFYTIYRLYKTIRKFKKVNKKFSDKMSILLNESYLKLMCTITCALTVHLTHAHKEEEEKIYLSPTNEDDNNQKESCEISRKHSEESRLIKCNTQKA